MALLKRLSLMPAVLSFPAVIVLLFLELKVGYEPEPLLSILNALFTGVLPLCAVIMTYRIYLKINLPSTLLLNCGLLVFGMGTTAAGFMEHMANGLNLSTTIHNVSALIASIFLLTGTMLGTKKGKLYKYREINIILTTVGIVALMAGVIMIIYFGLLPPFYAQIGATLTRQIILGMAITFFFTSAVLMSKLYLMQRKDYFLWYAAALFMLTAGLIAMVIQPDPESPIRWIARADQYLGGVYFIICILSLRKQTELHGPNYEIANDFFIDAEQVYRSLAESSSDAIVSVDENFKIFYSNSAASTLFGLTKDNIRGTSFLDMLGNELERERIREIVRAFVQSGTHDLQGETLEMEALSHEGRTFPIELSVTIRKLESGIASTYIIRDITFRRLAQQKAAELAGSLRKQLEFEQTVMKLAQDFINAPIERMDQSIRDALRLIAGYVQADQVYMYHYDWQKERLSSVVAWDDKPDQNGYAKEEQLPAAEVQKIIQLFKNDEYMEYADLLGLPEDSLDRLQIPRDGSGAVIVFKLSFEGKVNGTFAVSTLSKERVWSDSEKTMMRLFAELLSNALARKVRMEALNESEERNKLLLDSTSDGIMMLDRNGTILNINKSFAKRYRNRMEKIIGRKWTEYIPEKEYADLYDQRRRRFISVFETGKAATFDDNKDGKTFHNRFYPVFKDGVVTAVTLFSTDISDRIRAQEEIHKTAEYLSRMRIQTEFFTNISHELKTPLSIILIQLELLKLYRLDEAKVNEYVAAATQNAYRLTRLVMNLLDITKLDAGYMKAALAYTDIVPVIREITGSVGDYARDKEIHLQFETKSIGYVMATDRDKLERIMMNLLSNAVKHTKGGGRIHVCLKGKPDGVHISVADTGEGIPKEKLGIIFDRFAQVDTSLTRKTEGSGIGLALTKSLVELLKGRIWVESAPGKGSTFHIELPAQKIDEGQTMVQVEGYDLEKRVQMEFSDVC